MKIKKITKVDEKISNFIFNLRNKDYVRKNSLRNSKITIKNHKVWIKNFLKKNNILYIITIREVPIGYVRLELERKIYNASWALIKKFHGKGYAKKILDYTTQKKHYKYKALIKKRNIASIKIAIHAKFKFKMSKNNVIYLYKN